MSLRVHLATLLRRAAARLDPPISAEKYELLQEVRAGFVRQGTTLSAWCKTHGVKRQNATTAILGGWGGPKAQQLIKQIVNAAGLDPCKEAV